MRLKKGILVALLVVFSLHFSLAAETEIEVNNTGPVLVQNIPDFIFYYGDNTNNFIDLDDYFQDNNGDSFILYHSPNPLNNISLSIDTQNRLSLTYDTGYEGSNTLTITVSDGEYNATSNSFTITIGPDIEPPQWFTPVINRNTVYQNYFVTFSALWTDNAALREFILSVNQGSGWSNASSIDFTGTTNVSEDSLQISASPGTTVQWRIYAFDNRSNSNVTDIQTFDVEEFEISEEEFEEFIGGGSAGSGSGSRESSSRGADGGISLESFSVDTSSIRLSLRQGDTATRVLRITNLLDTPLNFDANIENIGDLAVISERSFTIPAGEVYELTFDVLVKKKQMPDQYFGSIIIGAGDNVVIPVILDIKPFDAAIQVVVNVSEETKFVNQGDEVTALISITNLLDSREGDAELFYAIKDFQGNIIESANETIPSFVQGFQEQRSLTVPEGVADGEYIFYAIAFFQDRIDLDSDIFGVGFKFRIIRLLQQFLYLIIFLALLFIVIYLYWLYKRSKRKKKLLELYLLLSELKKLVKDGKTKEALGVYKRIKVTYGQKIPRDYIKDEVKLKEELDKFAKLLKTTPVVPAPAKVVPVKNAAKPSISAKPVASKTSAPTKPSTPKPVPTKPALENKAVTPPKPPVSQKPKLVAKKVTNPTKPSQAKPEVVPKQPVPKQSPPKVTAPKPVSPTPPAPAKPVPKKEVPTPPKNDKPTSNAKEEPIEKKEDEVNNEKK